MIYSYADVRALAAVADTEVLRTGVANGEKWKLLEVRTPCDVVADAILFIYIDGIQRLQLVPTIVDNVMTIDEEYDEGSEFVCVVHKEDATAQVIGVVLVFDRKPR